jgi:hypothetical protein
MEFETATPQPKLVREAFAYVGIKHRGHGVRRGAPIPLELRVTKLNRRDGSAQPAP